jgi:hypothetical protein
VTILRNIFARYWKIIFLNSLVENCVNWILLWLWSEFWNNYIRISQIYYYLNFNLILTIEFKKILLEFFFAQIAS